MRIGAYQFAVSGNISENFEKIKSAIVEASKQGVRLLVFPECALTGYPPRDIPNAAAVASQGVASACRELKTLAKRYDMYLLVGMVAKERDRCFNSAVLFSPDGRTCRYDKRALWGWDSENFTSGDRNGIFEIDGIKIGVRICFEIRFPEYFRELYQARTELNVVLFYDVADTDDMERYILIKSHIRTRAVENVAYTVTVNSTAPYQTAPTGIYDKSGGVIKELERNREGLLIYDFANSKDDFGEQGRRFLSNQLIGKA